MPLTRSALTHRAKSIKLIAMDVDGVLTGGEIIVFESGEEIKFWNAKDRLIIALINKKMPGFKFAWITGRSSDGVTAAAHNLGIHHVVQNCHDKRKALVDILKKENLRFKDAVFIGDDLIDLPALRVAGLSACPLDAASDVQRNVNYISRVPGGKGVIRDVLEFILKAQKKWDRLLKPFLS